MTSNRVTIREVAAQAGVSVATVSKVLNDRHGVAADTLLRVRAAIDELGYESSLVARSLRNHRTNVVGVLVWAIEPYSAELLKGVARGLKGTGYELVVYSTGGEAGGRVGWERRYLSRLSGTLIDGAVLVTPTVSTRDIGSPVVAVDPHSGGDDGWTVAADNARGARLAVEHLLELGHRRIGFLGRPPRDLESSRQREAGYRSALKAAGIPFDPDLLRNAGYEAHESSNAARALLTLPQRPTAVFAANDVTAIATMETALTLGMRVPQDLSVIGFDNIPESTMVEPALTTIEQPLQLMGQRAVEMLLDLLGGREPGEGQVMLPTRLVVRGSCAEPAAAGAGAWGGFAAGARGLPFGAAGGPDPGS
ncbi:LacI family DNA-binding transcriptional regulator [Streptomyces sp. TS71-3]|uniref:LacI family DNA-binding transcriptional regulator n=1 Tax=Streptomyces sp. TS71-3 TaxID=2733862 RepID=UPI001B26E18F|nr:LacI family DNA-binding transcriptional regulator [Streptomyces sp. TS71-3]GHJ39214.1 LacI family transcriptional regulator [Streptomyces sp. TS71-3]